MAPRKKQRIDHGLNQAASEAAVPVPTVGQAAAPARRTTRAAAKAAREGKTVSSTTKLVQPSQRQRSTEASQNLAKRPALKGRLKTLLEIPDELQREVFSYLTVADLLGMARVSKEFRAYILTKKNEKSLWKPARANTTGLPARPPFMSEPAFVHLLYSPHCHGCGANNIRKVLFGCFMRLCASCLQKRTIWLNDAQSTARGMDTHRTWHLPSLFHGDSVANNFIVHAPSTRHYDEKYNRILKEHVEDVFARYKALPTPVTREAFLGFVATLRGEFQARLPHARAVHEWVTAQEQARQASLGDAKTQRFDAILERLRASGWEKDLDFMGEKGIQAMSNMPVVRQSSKLTEGAWQKVLAALDKFLNDTRATRLETELRDAVIARFAALEDALVAHYVTLPRKPYMDCRPQPIDFAFEPECRAILDVPTAETVTADQFSAIIPKLTARWEADVKKQLAEYIRPLLGDVAPGVDVLELAIAFFSCAGRCRDDISVLRYPAILTHECSCSSTGFRSVRCTSDEFDTGDAYTRAVKSLKWSEYSFNGYKHRDRDLRAFAPFYMAFPSEHDGPSYSAGVVNTMRRIVSAMGLDPRRATFADMVQRDVWLRCVACEARDPAGEICAYSWRGAYSHEQHHSMSWDWRSIKRAVSDWRVADEEDMVRVRKMQASETMPAWRTYTLWSCALCPAFNDYTPQIKLHLKETHGVTDVDVALRDGTIYLHPSEDFSGVRSTYIRLREPIKLPKSVD